MHERINTIELRPMQHNGLWPIIKKIPQKTINSSSNFPLKTRSCHCRKNTSYKSHFENSKHHVKKGFLRNAGEAILQASRTDLLQKEIYSSLFSCFCFRFLYNKLSIKQ